MFRLEDEFRSLVERGGESRKLNRVFRGESNGMLSFDSGDDEEEEEEEVIGDGEEHQIPTAQPIDDYDIVIALPSGTINNLHEIAKRMVAAGFKKECSHVYRRCRREFLEESMSRLGLQKLSIEEVQKTPWQDLEDEIKLADIRRRDRNREGEIKLAVRGKGGMLLLGPFLLG
ncbi:hypothetical protein ACFX2J_013002 [Malus domestica]